MTEDGRVKGETQTGYLLTLRIGLLPPALRAQAARYLVADIERKGWHLSTGFVGVGSLCPVLTEAGYNEVAYRLLLNDTFPWLETETGTASRSKHEHICSARHLPGGRDEIIARRIHHDQAAFRDGFSIDILD